MVLLGAIISTVLLWPTHPSQADISNAQASKNVSGSADLLWNNRMDLPGSTATADGLRINPVPFAIVNQDGTPGQTNPPVNLYGAHLQAQGDFAVSASLRELQLQGSTASISLYGQVPIIADEFRYERASLHLTFDGATLHVQTRQDATQTTATKDFPLKYADDSYDVTITRQDGLITFTVNGIEVGSIPENKLFDSGQVWFGASATNNSWLLTSLHAQQVGDTPLRLVNAATLKVPQTDTQALNTLAQAKRPGFTIGAAMALGPMVSDPEYAQVALGGNFGQMTTENALKWQFVHPAPDMYDFREADALVALAQRHNMTVHGHTLVFGEANPAWVQALPTTTAADKQHVQQVMTDHINTVVGHFKGKIATWDVVNEPLADDDFDPSNGQIYRNHIWYKAMGEDYIATAFQAAHQADPQAKLFMNEFGLEEDGDRWDTFLALVTKLKQQGVPIDGVGFQAHVYEAGDKIDTIVLKRHIEQLKQIGLVARVSEMDVYDDDGQAVQATQYADVVNVCINEPNCISFTTWGVSDRYDMWRDSNTSPPQYGADFLWDQDMKPTPAVDAVRHILSP